MLNVKTDSLFETELLKLTIAMIEQEFGTSITLPAELYHYTSPENQQSIIDSQAFHASFIRSSSDGLEFTLPFAACRNWLCRGERFFEYQNFPIELFKHFTEQAIDPKLRPYFISLSADSNSKHLQSLYGVGRLKFNITSIKDYCSLTKCKYVESVQGEVFRILSQWKNEVFDKTLREFKIENPADRSFLKSWFYIFMHLCYCISFTVKDLGFEKENEIRIVTTSKNPDLRSPWHDPRKAKPLSSRSLLSREYLPVNLEEIGITVSL